MATNIDRPDIVERDGVVAGPFRSPCNLASDQRGSIHDDQMAQKLGFRGGTVAGSIHMEQFPPLLIRAFGQQWFETGSLSTYFRNATTDREPVRAFVEVPAAADHSQVRVWMEKEDGTLVLEGTASAGNPPAASYVRTKRDQPRDAGELRILAGLSADVELAPVTTRLTDRESRPRLAVVTEPLDWYTGPSPWGGAIANPGLAVHLMVKVQDSMRLTIPAVGLYGAIEVRHIHGPVFAEHDYTASGTILALGTTPKTEYMWYESNLFEPATGTRVAQMIMMLRFMKASARVWRE